MSPTVAFHFGTQDKLGYVCRLLRKTTGMGVRVLVVSPSPTAQRLDAALWALSSTDFVTHAHASEKRSSLRYSAVILSDTAESNEEGPNVLVNLLDTVPTGFELFEKVIEIVSTDESDRLLARERWKAYARRGIDIIRHDVKTKM